jgi:hypothetical protein
MEFIHHGPEKIMRSRGSGGVGVILSKESVEDWEK